MTSPSNNIHLSSERFFSEFTLLLLNRYKSQDIHFLIALDRSQSFCLVPKISGIVGYLERCLQTVRGTSYNLKQHEITLFSLAESRLKAAQNVKEVRLETISELLSIETTLNAVSKDKEAKAQILKEVRQVVNKLKQALALQPKYQESRLLPTNPAALLEEANIATAFAQPKTAPACKVKAKNCRNVLDLFSKLLRTHQGICLGERHDDVISNYLSANMKQLKALGITTIFTEQFYYSRQNHIDDYLQTGSVECAKKAARFPDNVASKPFQLFFHHKRLLDAARQEGVRVVGIDGHTDPDGRERQIEMNYLAQRVIEKEKGTGKFLALMGLVHVTTSYNGTILGVAERIQTPSVALFLAKDSIQKDKAAGAKAPQFIATLYKSLRLPFIPALELGDKILALRETEEENDDWQNLQRAMIVITNEPEEAITDGAKDERYTS